jgi:hypothetical protein
MANNAPMMVNGSTKESVVYIVLWGIVTGVISASVPEERACVFAAYTGFLSFFFFFFFFF